MSCILYQLTQEPIHATAKRILEDTLQPLKRVDSTRMKLVDFYFVHLSKFKGTNLLR